MKIKMPIKVDPIIIKDNVLMAPMSGVTDVPFRKMVRKFGAALVSSEMIASRPTLDEYKRLKNSKNWSYKEELPLSAQIAGCEPDIMAEVAKIKEQQGASLIDINFGCPVKKVVNNFAGSALMKDLALATKIMESVVASVNVPVTVKMRLGWDEDSINAPDLARIAQECGVKMITVHGRTRSQLYNGKADWKAVRAVKQAVSIPVIVNGDIYDSSSAQKAMEDSGADGVMIGRAAYGRPWAVKSISCGLQGLGFQKPSLLDLRDVVLEHYELLLSHYGAHIGNITARKHIGWYCATLPDADELRGKINALSEAQKVSAEIKSYFDCLLQAGLAATPA